MSKIPLKYICNFIHNWLDSATIILVICLLVMVIIIWWNHIYNNRDKFITILCFFAIIIIVFLLYYHINLNLEIIKINNIMCSLAIDMDAIIDSDIKIPSKNNSDDFTIYNIIVLVVFLCWYYLI